MCESCLAEPGPLSADFFCAACRTPFLTPHPLDEAGLCGLCRRGLNGFDFAYSYGFYDGTLRKLIHLFKYTGIETLARPLAGYLAVALPREDRFDWIVPVPMHWRRRWARGFNQSALLARELARRTGLKMAAVLRRNRPTPPQAGLSQHERRRNVAHAFTVRRAGPVQGGRVLLVDDVLTTGATASACAAVLKRAGARHVSVLTVARADRRISLPEPAGRALAASRGGR
ncbi:MAG: ComF family protein [Acidobacteria bacterium]|nr:ComF family protein [Acidobacteriota bacterium]